MIEQEDEVNVYPLFCPSRGIYAEVRDLWASVCDVKAPYTAGSGLIHRSRKFLKNVLCYKKMKEQL